MNQHAINSYIKAGKIVAELKTFTRELVEKDIKLIDIALAIDKKIEELGGEPAFPVNLSIDEVAAHFTPALGDESVAKGLLKIDIGVCVDGYIADTAITIDLTEDNKHKDMIKLNKKILLNVMEGLEPGTQVKKVGDTVQDTLEQWNKENNTQYSVIKGLSGHQLGQNVIHAGMTVSNYRNENKTELKDMAIAIEPFVTTGDGDIYQGSNGGIYALQSTEPVRDADARKILAYIKEKYKTRPFCSRWLEKKDFKRVRYVLNLLTKLGILHQYPMLIEKSKQHVSQFENTFLFANSEMTITTYEEGWEDK